VPAIVYYHGGGWVVGDLDSHDGSCRTLAKHSGCVVVSVDYRRAPEAAFPHPLEDCLAAFRHVYDHPQQYSVTPGAVAVMGDSAGANLAAAVCLVSRDEGPVPIAQSLVYPATDLRMTAPSIDTFATGFMLTKEDMLWYRGHYLPDPQTVLDPRVSPLLAEDLTGLPPAAVWTAGFDPLRDEGMAYAERLLEAGNQAQHSCFDDQIHGFFGMGVLPGGMDRIETVCRQTGDLVHRCAG
jgi:acetyl esterase